MKENLKGIFEKEQLSALMLNHGIKWEKKGIHEKHLSVLDLKKQERSKEVEKQEKKKRELQSIVQMEKQREQLLKEQKRAERRKQKREAR